MRARAAFRVARFRAERQLQTISSPLLLCVQALAALQLHAPGAWPALRALTFRSCVFLEPGRPSSSSTTSTPRAHHHNHHHPAGGAANGPAAAAAAAAAAFLGGHHNNNGAANGGRGALALFGAADRERRQAALLQAVKVRMDRFLPTDPM